MESTEEELNKLIEFRKKLTEYTYELRDRAGDNMLEAFCERRKLPLEIVKESDIFYITDATEMLLPRFLGDVEDFGVISPTNKRPIFHNRWVMPIKDNRGLVQNLVGYSWNADERYVYGTAKYYRRRETLYGLENLELAYDLGYAILTEGITDTIRVRSLGYLPTFANCGTHNSDFIIKQLNRCRYGIIKIPDRDAPGKRAANKWNANRSVTLNTFIKYKDIDEMCSDEENIEWIKQYIDASIEWLKTSEHRGYKAQSQSLNMQ